MNYLLCTFNDQIGHNDPHKFAVFNGWKHIKTNDVGSSSSDKDFETKKIESNNFSSKFNFSDFFSSEIQKKKSDSTYRVFRKVLRDATQFPFADELSSGFKRRISVWCSNDYMGLSWHPKVQEAAVYVFRLFNYVNFLKRVYFEIRYIAII